MQRSFAKSSEFRVGVFCNSTQARIRRGRWRTYGMDQLASASALIDKCRPERPVRGLRPHAAGRAARWFLDKFPGDVAYAYKANSSVFLIGALYGAGIRHFDVASLPEIEDAATIPDAHLHFMHPVKSRHAIRRAYDLGVRSFSLDGEDELDKIMEATGGARDLLLWVRVAVTAINSRIPLERKFGAHGEKAAKLLIKTRQVAAELGLTFHVGSQTTTPDAFVTALGEVTRIIVKSGVMIDRLDIGGGFPARYPDSDPAPLQDFVDVILANIETMPVKENIKLMCEPGRALVAEAESLIVRVDARRGNNLYINDGSYGMLFDAAHLGFIFPTRLISRSVDASDPLVPFELWGPTCDSIDHMKGPFLLPDSVREGDYIEIGNMGAYARAIAGRFNGYGEYDEVILLDPPVLSMYGVENTEVAAARG
jgi:ornithine decarboxylase